MKRKIIPYKPHLKELARKLRKESTLTEIMLWYELKGRKLRGYDSCLPAGRSTGRNRLMITL